MVERNPKGAALVEAERKTKERIGPLIVCHENLQRFIATLGTLYEAAAEAGLFGQSPADVDRLYDVIDVAIETLDQIMNCDFVTEAHKDMIEAAIQHFAKGQQQAMMDTLRGCADEMRKDIDVVRRDEVAKALRRAGIHEDN